MNPDSWKSFFRLTLTLTAAACLLVIVFVVIADPYDVLPFSPAFKRLPVVSERQYALPALARKPEYDSAIIGSSIVQSFDPKVMDNDFGGNFVNLSIWGGIPPEIEKLAAIYAHSHHDAKTVFLGLDSPWCAGSKLPRRPQSQFPKWIFGPPKPKDLRLVFNLPMLEDAIRQMGNITGLWPLPADKYADGFHSFLPEDSAFDLAKVRARIYGQEEPLPIPGIESDKVLEMVKSQKMIFAETDNLQRILGMFSPETRFVIVFVPYHLYVQRSQGLPTEAYFEGCKQALTDIARSRSNTAVLDFMIDSPITRDDTNYWDAVHTKQSMSKMVIDMSVAALHGDPIANRYEQTRLMQ